MQVQTFRASDGANLAFRDQGEGLPVLCLAGLTRDGRDFDFLAPHLPDVRLIRPDYRGRGASEWTGAETYTVTREAEDALELLDHLGISQAAIIGASRGGMIGMFLAARAKDRMRGLCLNDVGPVLDRAGLERIFDYVGRNPSARRLEDLVARMPQTNPGFEGVPADRWAEVAQRLCRETPEGLRITYDPSLRSAFIGAFTDPLPDLWPLFDACAGLPLALIRGANSDLLSAATADEMQRRRPDLIRAEVPGRAHMPFLDEPDALAAVRGWITRITGRSAEAAQ